MATYENSPQAILPRFSAGSELANQDWVIAYLQTLIDNRTIGSYGKQFVGAGTPEGSQVGATNPPDIYWDTTNKILYIKDADDGLNTGWQAH